MNGNKIIKELARRGLEYRGENDGMLQFALRRAPEGKAVGESGTMCSDISIEIDMTDNDSYCHRVVAVNWCIPSLDSGSYVELDEDLHILYSRRTCSCGSYSYETFNEYLTREANSFDRLANTNGKGFGFLPETCLPVKI